MEATNIGSVSETVDLASDAAAGEHDTQRAKHTNSFKNYETTRDEQVSTLRLISGLKGPIL